VYYIAFHAISCHVYVYMIDSTPPLALFLDKLAHQLTGKRRHLSKKPLMVFRYRISHTRIEKNRPSNITKTNVLVLTFPMTKGVDIEVLYTYSYMLYSQYITSLSLGGCSAVHTLIPGTINEILEHKHKHPEK